MYVKTAFEDLPRDAFIEEPVNGRTIYRLAGVDGWAAFSAAVEHTSGGMVVVQLTLEKEIIEEVSFHPVNRGFNSLIDATVHATRFIVTRDPELKTLIDYHTGIVRKCGGKKELEALDLLMKQMA